MAHEATTAEEEYLESLFWLFEAGLPMTGANLSRAMQLSAPTVHEMLGRLERDGYIARDVERTIAFTPSGRDHAERLVSRHRMIERFLTDVVGVPCDGDLQRRRDRLGAGGALSAAADRATRAARARARALRSLDGGGR